MFYDTTTKIEELLTLLPISRKYNTALRAMLLYLPREDWKVKNPPRFIVVAIKKNHGFRYEFGWK